MTTRPLVAIIPSYARPLLLSRTVEQVKTHAQPDDILILDQPAGHPLGSAHARNLLVAQALEKHGQTVAILSLDDDLDMNGQTTPQDFRATVDLLDERPGIGIIQLPNRHAPTKKPLSILMPACHAFLINGEMAATGINYDPDEYADEVSLSIAAYFAGWSVVSTGRASVKHAVSQRGRIDKTGGGIEGAYRDGIKVVCRQLPAWRDAGWLTYDPGYRDGIELPTPYASIRITPAGREVHRQARAAMGFSFGRTP
jgi:hypothetical protein